jgi:hypothetical protein
VLPRRHRNGAEGDVRREDRRVLPVERRAPARGAGVGEGEVARALGIDADRDALGLVDLDRRGRDGSGATVTRLTGDLDDEAHARIEGVPGRDLERARLVRTHGHDAPGEEARSRQRRVVREEDDLARRDAGEAAGEARGGARAGEDAADREGVAPGGRDSPGEEPLPARPALERRRERVDEVREAARVSRPVGPEVREAEREENARLDPAVGRDRVVGDDPAGPGAAAPGELAGPRQERRVGVEPLRARRRVPAHGRLGEVEDQEPEEERARDAPPAPVLLSQEERRDEPREREPEGLRELAVPEALHRARARDEAGHRLDEEEADDRREREPHEVPSFAEELPALGGEEREDERQDREDARRRGRAEARPEPPERPDERRRHGEDDDPDREEGEAAVLPPARRGERESEAHDSGREAELLGVRLVLAVLHARHDDARDRIAEELGRDGEEEAPALQARGLGEVAVEGDPLPGAGLELEERGHEARRPDPEAERERDGRREGARRERASPEDQGVERRERDPERRDLQVAAQDRGADGDSGEREVPPRAGEAELDAEERPGEPRSRDRPEVELEPARELPREAVDERRGERGLDPGAARPREQERPREREGEVREEHGRVRGPRREPRVREPPGRVVGSRRVDERDGLAGAETRLPAGRAAAFAEARSHARLAGKRAEDRVRVEEVELEVGGRELPRRPG